MSSTPDPVVPVPQSQLDIMMGKLDSLIHVTAQIDRRMEALEERRERDAKLSRQNATTADRLREAMVRLQLRHIIARAAPGAWVMGAAIVAAVLASVVTALVAHGTVATEHVVRNVAELPAVTVGP